ncbi:hypothetical protein MTR_7g010220 [Medicago truncatula]|uniref:Uncharacterized protein n=1 Tax=Medicago truncatula TaxID=3880 RepID=Q2HVT3_MEDTR|nr:hypothetical protein MtrDRAFT_AC148762g32v2 [Medicago truncatula]ABN08926.1 hypothetical protein MtrDRAFT_AC166313g10v2 [Medicago truncatula]AES77405.1 hypothetical protein MTR_7g010220 [Medicago truncatula]
MASGTLSFRCVSVPLEAVRSRSLSCLVHRRPLPALVSLGCYNISLKTLRHQPNPHDDPTPTPPSSLTRVLIPLVEESRERRERQ